jgi:hypothetical protein
MVFGVFFDFLYQLKVPIQHELVFSLGQMFSFTVFQPLTEIDTYRSSVILSLVFTSMIIIVALVNNICMKGGCSCEGQQSTGLCDYHNHNTFLALLGI